MKYFHFLCLEIYSFWVHLGPVLGLEPIEQTLAHVRFHSCQFGFHGFPPFFGMGTISSLGASGAVGSIGSQGGRKDLGWDIRDSEGISVICKVGLKVGREDQKEVVAVGRTKTSPVTLEEGKLGELAMLNAHGGMAGGMANANVGDGGGSWVQDDATAKTYCGRIKREVKPVFH